MLKVVTMLFTLLCIGACVWHDPESAPEYLPLNDAFYPYAGLPRFVIETENFKQILDKETKIPAHLQIYGESAPESEIMDLTVNGRGNSSYEMAKIGMKLKLANSQKLLGMPKNRDWVLISNHRDLTFLKNYVTYQLAAILNDEYAPRCKFVELYFNREYKGVYLLAEHIEVAPNRVNIPENEYSFLVEKTSDKTTGASELDNVGNYLKQDDETIFSTSLNYIFKFNYPKDPSEASIALIQERFNDFEKVIQKSSFKNYSLDSLNTWIDVNDFVRYYWIQEFSRNLDGAFRRSVFLTWQVGEPIKMGPVWDFDLAYGTSSFDKVPAEGWYVKKYGWYRFLEKNLLYAKFKKDYWQEHRSTFENILDSIDVESKRIVPAMKNEFKRWPVLENDSDWPFIEKYKSYEAAVDSMKLWIRTRIDWIDKQL